MALRVGTPLPSFEGATQWFNGEVTTAELSNHPVLIHFWAVSCPACVGSVPALEHGRKTYASQGLRFVSVHLPRLNSDHDAGKVQEAIEKHGIVWPCAVDSDGVIGERFETCDIWPYYFLFDAEGRMRSRAAGRVGLRLVESALQRLLERT